MKIIILVKQHSSLSRQYRKKKGVYDLWKKGQATQENYKYFVRLHMEKIRRAKA